MFRKCIQVLISFKQQLLELIKREKMKNAKYKVNPLLRLIVPICLLFIIASCGDIDQTEIIDTEDVNGEFMLTDAWICDMKSFEEDGWYYELYMQDNGDYIAVSNNRMLKVSKDGTLDAMIMLSYDDDNYGIVRMHNDKIYRFHTDNDFQNYDPSIAVQLEIYDFDFTLLGAYELDTKGLIYDAELENDETFGLLVYDVDAVTMTLKKIHLTDGLMHEVILSTNGTSPTNLSITESGQYICSASSNKKNLSLLDNDLNIIWANEYDDYLVSDLKYVPGQGIYITGRVSTFFDPERPTYIALIDLDGNVVNSFLFDAGERWAPFLEINDERICLIQTEPETGLNMLFSILDLDLNLESTLEIPGNIVQSDIKINENGSFSFVYGIALDPEDPATFPENRNTRIFKFDMTYSLPTNIIVQ